MPVYPSTVLNSMNEFIKLLYPLALPRNPRSHDNNHEFDGEKEERRRNLETILKSF